MSQFVYSDLRTDLAVGGDGNFILVTDEDAINQSIQTILSTMPGERVMFPTFGSGVPRIVFNVIDDMSASDLQQEIFNSIEQWENRVSLTSVNVIPDYDNNWYVINIAYQILATGQNVTFSGKIDTQT